MLDESGVVSAALNIPPAVVPRLAGTQVNQAFGVIVADASKAEYSLASGPPRLDLLP